MESFRFPFSRRDFLKTVGAGGVAAGAIAPAETEAQPAVREIGPGEVPIQLTINGKRHDLTLELRTTLLDALRKGSTSPASNASAIAAPAVRAP
jgi:xanthine dehydrogenase YagT iron-sulfur-binding subunit